MDIAWILVTTSSALLAGLTIGHCLGSRNTRADDALVREMVRAKANLILANLELSKLSGLNGRS